MKKLFIGIIGFLLFNVTVQAESYDFSLIPYNVTNACEFTEEIGGQECFDKMLDGELEEFKITDNRVSKNNLIMIVLNMKTTLDSKISDARIVIDTDPEVLLSQTNEFDSESASNDRVESQNGGILPLNGKRTPWSINSAHYLENGKILFFMSDSSKKTPIVKEGNLIAIFFKVSENVSNGTTTTISYNSDLTQLSNNSFQKIDYLANYNSLTLTVSNDLNQIESNVYTIKREENLSYIYGTNPNTKIVDYLINFENNPSELHIYDFEGNEILDNQRYITTNTRLKLIKNNEIKDELVVVVKGDVNCDGDVTVSDEAKLGEDILGHITLNTYERIAGDINNDGYTNIADKVRFRTYLLMQIDNLN